ncbi:uncharacterized protein LOC109722564 [Ananas comosus]|uniref:Uncharacterized protein LOC109722564 n=1 Tax=Ananas comosus TaxID=4615 RepID=A0A6P5GEF0_ANACO|nr:uncharacterized protein LOC109722564 [Ananas comosus]
MEASRQLWRVSGQIRVTLASNRRKTGSAREELGWGIRRRRRVAKPFEHTFDVVLLRGGRASAAFRHPCRRADSRFLRRLSVFWLIRDVGASDCDETWFVGFGTSRGIHEFLTCEFCLELARFRDSGVFGRSSRWCRSRGGSVLPGISVREPQISVATPSEDQDRGKGVAS